MNNVAKRYWVEEESEKALGMSSKNFPILCGILAPIVAYLSIGIAIMNSPWFSWEKNALSDLGRLGNPNGWIFNLGMMVSGCLAAIFSIGLLLRGKHKAASCMILASSIFLVLIGAFPEGSEPPMVHFIVSALFFASAPAGFFLIGYLSEEKGSFLLQALSALSYVVWAVRYELKTTLGPAIPEMISSIFLGACLITLSFMELHGE